MRKSSSRPKDLLLRSSAYSTFCLHGHAIAMVNEVPELNPALSAFLGGFEAQHLPDGISCVEAHLRPYVESEVLRHLSASAAHIPTSFPWIELYQDSDRFWLIDERWGLAEINFLRGQFKSFVLPQTSLSAVELLEGAFLWPLAQLLRPRGLHLLPATALARRDSGVLLLTPTRLPTVLRSTKVIGRPWTALREEDGRVDLLRLPGMGENARPSQLHAYCDAVAVFSAAPCDPTPLGLLRRHWPMLEIHPTRRGSTLAGVLAQSCRCIHAPPPQTAADWLRLLEVAFHSQPAPLQSRVRIDQEPAWTPSYSPITS